MRANYIELAACAKKSPSTFRVQMGVLKLHAPHYN